MTDLTAFNHERVVRTIARCPVPVISAVGHEVDLSLADLAADARASTPTAAAKLVVPDLRELVERLERQHASLARGARRSLERHSQRVTTLGDRLRRAPSLTLERHGQRVTNLGDRLRRAPALAVERKAVVVERQAARLRALSPRATLARGYAIVRKGEEIVRAAAKVEPGDALDVEVAEGSFGAHVD